MTRWNYKKVGGQPEDSLAMSSGQLSVEVDKLVGMEFTAAMTTLRNIDKGEANPFNVRLNNQLQGNNFFAVATSQGPLQAVKKTPL